MLICWKIPCFVDLKSATTWFRIFLLLNLIFKIIFMFRLKRLSKVQSDGGASTRIYRFFQRLYEFQINSFAFEMRLTWKCWEKNVITIFNRVLRDFTSNYFSFRLLFSFESLIRLHLLVIFSSAEFVILHLSILVFLSHFHSVASVLFIGDIFHFTWKWIESSLFRLSGFHSSFTSYNSCRSPHARL